MTILSLMKIEQHVSAVYIATIHRVRKKRVHKFSLFNFYKCRHSFVIFGMNHPEDLFDIEVEKGSN